MADVKREHREAAADVVTLLRRICHGERIGAAEARDILTSLGAWNDHEGEHDYANGTCRTCGKTCSGAEALATLQGCISEGDADELLAAMEMERAEDAAAELADELVRAKARCWDAREAHAHGDFSCRVDRDGCKAYQDAVDALRALEAKAGKT